MIFLQKNIRLFFEDILNPLSCDPHTKAYITSIYLKFLWAEYDLSNHSITLLFLQAREKQNFSEFQNIADYIFYIRTMAPSYLSGASEEYYRSIGRISYHSCYKLLNRQWKLFDELADNFVVLETEAYNAIKNAKLV